MDGIVSDALTLRFDEWTRYDPATDAEVSCLLAITGRGTYHVEFPHNGPSSDREMRKLFRTYVVHAMEEGVPPHKLDLEDVLNSTRGEYLG